MSAPRRLGLLGGTFDPIHCGHLAAAEAAATALGLETVRFVPSARPPHRPDRPRASGYHRLQMVRLAIAAARTSPPGTGPRGRRWEASDLELRREGESYTFDTLRALHREGLSPLQLYFITGADAFAEIATWYAYPEVLAAAHFAVIARPGVSLGTLQQRLPALAHRMSEPSSAVPSETRIFLIEAATPEVSSTDIRGRIARGESLQGLVPDEVAAYIAQHALYGRENHHTADSQSGNLSTKP